MALLADPRIEQFALLGSVAIAAVAIGHGVCVRHRRVLPLFVMASGFALYLCKGQLGESAEPYLLTVGAALVAIAHLLNLRCHRSEQPQ